MTRPALSRRAALLCGVATLAAGTTTAAPVPPRPTDAVQVPRRVLALFDGSIETLRKSSVHGLLAMPLEWLGLTLDYHDIRTGLPPVWTDPDVRAVVSWYPEPNLPDYAAYVGWIEAVTAAGIRVVQIDDAGPKPGSVSPPAAISLRRRLFAALGIRALGQWSTLTLGDSIVRRDDAQIGFERQLDGPLPPYELYAPALDSMASWLVLERADQARSRSHLVMVGPKGGFIAPGFAVIPDMASGVRQWLVNPFSFLEAALGMSDVPAADTTTLCGRRIFYSHVDGDGWRSISQVRLPGRAAMTNAEVTLRAVIADNPDLPVTVAPIAAEMDPGFAGDLRAINAARNLFKLDHVEAATHTYTHPFRWSFFRDYDPTAEVPYQAVYAKALTGRSTIVETFVTPPAAGCCTGVLDREHAPPRAFGGRPFDLEQEVSGAAALTEAVAGSASKRVRLLQWPGDCSPFPAALRCVAQAGLLNINGGDTRCDDEFPSVSAVAPVGFRQDGNIQIYASASSEELYTDLWTDRFFGFRDLPTTWDRTGAPRRLKPLNLYYHMYSAERRASLDALLGNIDALRSRGDFIGIRASQFASLANGFFTARLRRETPQSWRVLDRGTLQTIRWSGADSRMLDPAASVGVLGERIVGDQLYVALDPAVETPLVVLTKRADRLPPRPLLIQSAWNVSHLEIGKGSFVFAADGFGPGRMEWRLPGAGVWRVRSDGSAVDVTVGRDGVLHLDLAGPAITPMRIEIVALSS